METTVSSPRVTRKERWPDARRSVAILLALGYGAFLLFAFSWSRCFFDGCPNVDTLAAFQPGGAPVLLDRNGEVFADLTPVARKVVPLFSLPSHVAQAFLAVEDKRFYEHRGIDWRRVGGAVVANLRAGGFDQGFSTITMQLARNVFPNRIPGAEQTTRRKLLEVRVAREIEEKYSKDEILELYLNHIYFGNRARGIEAAAHQYFGHSAEKLTLEEAAVLAALPKAPSHYDPRRHPEKALERRNLVISLMEDQGRLPWIQANAARKAPLRLAPAPRQARVESGLAPYFVEQVRRELEETFGAALYTQPLRVVTTLDSRIQRAAEEELLRQLKLVESGTLGRYQAPLYSALASPPEDGTRYLQGAAVMLDTKNGDVLAWVGGRNYAHSQFDRVSQARRQPGSAWKPFVYAAALEQGFVLSQPLADTRLRMRLPGGKVWEPQNFTGRYEGRVTLRDALVRSKNVPTVRLASAIGLGQVADVAREAGIEEPVTELPSMALGTVTVSPLELTAAYTAFANLGEAVAPRLVLRVEDERGRILWESRPDRRPALEPSVAYLITDVLAEALERGTGTQVREAGVAAPAAGKTGTTNDGADVWFVGYTPELVAGVWIGFDQPKTILGGATGGGLAAPVWGRIVQRVYQDRKRPEPWKAPQGVVSRRVDPQTGLLLKDGCAPRGGRPAREELFVEGIEPAAYCPGKGAIPRDGFPAARMIAERKARETEEEAAEEARLAAIREAEERKRREEAEQARFEEERKGQEENRLAEIAEARRRAAHQARERREKELREEQARLAEQKRQEEEQRLAQLAEAKRLADEKARQKRETEERERKALLSEQEKREEAERIARAEAEEKRRREEAEKTKLAEARKRQETERKEREARELREREEKEKQTRLAQQKQREEAERTARAEAEEKRRKEEEAEKAKLAEARKRQEKEQKDRKARELREREERLAQAEAEADRREREIKSREEALRAGRRRSEEPERESEEERRDRIIREEERRAREDDDEERRAAPEDEEAEERTNDEERETAPDADLSGWWEMTNTIQSTNYSSYKGLRLGYRVQLEQDGDRIVGRGQKWTENGRTIPSAGRTPITVRGRVEGRQVILTFTEQGAKRRTSGNFSWTLSADRTTLRGSFESDAANASGSSLARRMP
ncbi:MAG TPA: PBP1A family penicillin-binding protein [Thermoanaerobaculia bacterium]|nr:PBP1A family penicillin-binding protein [Thermoanaerobaculia bacterium]